MSQTRKYGLDEQAEYRIELRGLGGLTEAEIDRHSTPCGLCGQPLGKHKTTLNAQMCPADPPTCGYCSSEIEGPDIGAAFGYEHLHLGCYREIEAAKQAVRESEKAVRSRAEAAPSNLGETTDG